MRYYVVDAFTQKIFQGNPAGICLLDKPVSKELMQKIAFENNLSETAFLLKKKESLYSLRWFTPETEIDLCGHATLGAAHVLMTEVSPDAAVMNFETQSGLLTVTKKEQGRYTLDFPSREPEPVSIPAGLAQALGCDILEAHQSRDLMVLLDSEETVRALSPDMTRLKAFSSYFGIIVTAPGAQCDFVYRYFAPGAGVPEDPVTGSACCTLTPYWSKRLRKSALAARQLSARGGALLCENLGSRVAITGSAVCYLKGELLALQG